MSHIKTTTVLAAVMIAILTITQTVSAATQYTPIDLGTLGGFGSIAYDINTSGQIVGDSGTASNGTHAFLWQNGQMTDLGTLDGDTLARGINDAGQVVGISLPASGEESGAHAFLWQKGKMIDIGAQMPCSASLAFDINKKGEITGTCVPSVGGILHGFLWKNGKMTDLGALVAGGSTDAFAINDFGQVVGRASTSDLEHAFLWQKGTMIDLGTLGGRASIAFDINNSGQIVGNSTTASGAEDGFLWKNGTMTDLGDALNAAGINDLGQIVGFDSDTRHAFLLQNGVVTDLGALGGGFSVGTAINNKGWAVGWSTIASGASHAVLFSP